MNSHKPLFSRALGADPDRLHFAAHSHHPWPDATRDAQLAAWDLAAERLDTKWNAIFSEVYPACQRHVARGLGLPDPSTVAFAPNTHELVYRVFSSLPTDRVLRVLSTDAEFHSFRRQFTRIEEAGRVEWVRVKAEPFDSLTERFARAVRRGGWDLVYASHVLFDSGLIFEEAPALLAEAADGGALSILDGYHAYMAVPRDFGPYADRVFYTSGGYKYAMSGEGCCFLHAPPGVVERPVHTGWFAGFDALAGPTPDAVQYPAHAGRFLGSTFDPTPLFRFDCALRTLAEAGLDAHAIHAHVRDLQERFLLRLEAGEIPTLRADELLPRRVDSEGRVRDRGHFLTFRRPDAGELQARLLAAGIVTDSRGDRLRFGFGIYHDPEDLDRLVERLGSA
ncbi:MAG: aminotransferase [Planctomycetota bacterium]